eukprot:ANDGO_06108.mRNA.1 Pachytene checkpoint protein 2 homolog
MNRHVDQVTVHVLVEARVKAHYDGRISQTESDLRAFLHRHVAILASGELDTRLFAVVAEEPSLPDSVRTLSYRLFNDIDKVVISLDSLVSAVEAPESVQLQFAKIDVFVYALCEEEPAEEPHYSHWILPHARFSSLWSSIVFDGENSGLKNQLWRYAATMMLYGTRGVNQSLVSCNRVILLHGPPGTGKTTLCRALAQQLSIRLGRQFPAGASLVEVQAHGLFSRFFSESGKLVQKLFKRIGDLLEDKDMLVCVLIDEVESLAAARSSSIKNGEPSDAVRAVNALLTHIDQLSYQSNVLVLTTSNLSQAMDVAFVDRADLKVFVGHPGLRARYEILKSCVEELQRCGIIVVHNETDRAAGEGHNDDDGDVESDEEEQEIDGDHSFSNRNTVLPFSDLASIANVDSSPSGMLRSIAARCSGLSGRVLRKIPFTAFAAHFAGRTECSLSEFLVALHNGVETELRSRAHFVENS